MAYSYETSSVKTINGEVSGLADVVARQAIANLPTLSGGEGIQIVNEDGKNRIDLGLSAGSNMSFVYDQETNTIRLDAEGGGIDWTTGAGLSAIVQDNGTSSFNLGQTPSGYGLIVDVKHNNGINDFTYTTELLDNKISTKLYLEEGGGIDYEIRDIGLNPYNAFQGSYIRYQDDVKQLTSSVYALNDNGLTYRHYYSGTWFTPTTSTTTWTWNDIDYLKSHSASLGKTYSGISPIVVNNTTNQISADTWSFSAGNGLVFTDDNANKVTKLEVEGETLSAGPGINIFESGGCVVISAGNDDYNFFPMTGTDGTTNYTANANFSSFTMTTGQGAAGAHVNMNVKGVHFEAYPATDVSASWYNIITQQDKITCSSVKLTTAASENRFYTSALPNLNKITFIAPSYGPYETYSALIDDGETTFVAEVDSGCCVTVVRSWSDDRNKNCWFGLNQESYFYIG